MEKKIKKIAAVLISLILAFCCVLLTGCKQGENGNVDKDKIQVKVFNGGYGTAWINNIIAAFEEDNPGTDIKLKTTVNSTTDETLISTGKSKDDIVMLNYMFWGETYNGGIEDISDVYAARPDGSGGKTIAEKCNPILLKHFNYNGKYYQISWATANGGVCYNKTSLDKVLGAGNWQVPVTTDQMNSVAKAMSDNGHYGYVYAGDDCYQDTYLIPAFMSQYMGYENYYNLCHGLIDDGNGNYSVATSENVYQLLSDQGIKRPYETLQEFTRYEHKYAYGIGFMDAQQIFYGWGYGSDQKLVAFMVNGDWLENETSSFSNNQDIRMMKTPVISALVDKLSFYTEYEGGEPKDFYGLSAEKRGLYDEKLDGIIRYVDGDSSVKPSYASDEDVTIVKNARNTYDSLSFMHGAAIPSTSGNKELAKRFLIYLYSDKAQRIYCETLKGLVMPYGYDYSSDPAFNGQVSGFMRSVNEAFDNEGFMVNLADYSSKIMYFGSFSPCAGCCVRFNRGTATADTIFEDIRTSYSKRWNTILSQAGYGS